MLNDNKAELNLSPTILASAPAPLIVSVLSITGVVVVIFLDNHSDIKLGSKGAIKRVNSPLEAIVSSLLLISSCISNVLK